VNFNGWSNFDDLKKDCKNTDSSNTNKSNNAGCYDIPNGFQSLNPELFVLISGLLGQIMAGSIPFNVQNALGNWFELLGQVILTYNAQQQYFQGGPGRFFDPQNYNINNQSCNTNQNTNSNKSTSKNPKTDSDENTKKIKELESRINDLMTQIEIIKKSIET
jgi:hypothetical protein